MALLRQKTRFIPVSQDAGSWWLRPLERGNVLWSHGHYGNVECCVLLPINEYAFATHTPPDTFCLSNQLLVFQRIAKVILWFRFQRHWQKRRRQTVMASFRMFIIIFMDGKASAAVTSSVDHTDYSTKSPFDVRNSQKFLSFCCFRLNEFQISHMCLIICIYMYDSNDIFKPIDSTIKSRIFTACYSGSLLHIFRCSNLNWRRGLANSPMASSQPFIIKCFQLFPMLCSLKRYRRLPLRPKKQNEE